MERINWEAKWDRVEAAQRALKKLEEGGEGALEAAEYMMFSHRIVVRDIGDLFLAGGLSIDEANELLRAMGEEEFDKDEWRDPEKYPWEDESWENE